MKKLIVLFFLFIAFNISAQIKPANSGVTYGAKTTKDGALSVSQMEEKLAANKQYKGKVQGKVVSVCQAEGCWMKLQQANGNDIMIRFKDHSFFVPKNIMGKEVVLNGNAKMTTTSIEMLKHYAEDAGKSKEEIEKITAPKTEIEFIAHGILVL